MTRPARPLADYAALDDREQAAAEPIVPATTLCSRLPIMPACTTPRSVGSCAEKEFRGVMLDCETLFVRPSEHRCGAGNLAVGNLGRCELGLRDSPKGAINIRKRQPPFGARRTWISGLQGRSLAGATRCISSPVRVRIPAILRVHAPYLAVRGRLGTPRARLNTPF